MSVNIYNKTKDSLTRVDGGGSGAIAMTMAEWVALDPKPQDGTQIVITDDVTKGGSENPINDDITSLDKTWSSKKINSYRIKAKEIEVSQGNDYNISQIFDEQIVNVINIVGAGNKIDFRYSLLDGCADSYTISILNGSGRVRIFYI